MDIAPQIHANHPDVTSQMAINSWVNPPCSDPNGIRNGAFFRWDDRQLLFFFSGAMMTWAAPGHSWYSHTTRPGRHVTSPVLSKKITGLQLEKNPHTRFCDGTRTRKMMYGVDSC